MIARLPDVNADSRTAGALSSSRGRAAPCRRLLRSGSPPAWLGRLHEFFPSITPSWWSRKLGRGPERGDFVHALRLLEALCQADLCSLDAHAHLGTYWLGHRPEVAFWHFEVGYGIGQLSLGPAFDGVLLWACFDNRLFLRCMHGYGLCLWRLGRFREAKSIFERMLWMNPSDNQGVRFLLRAVRAKRNWLDFTEEEGADW